MGSLWENFLISERLKFNNNNNKNYNSYFWRTTQGQEIDYLEEIDGVLNGYEFKWKKDKLKQQRIFLENYKNSSINLINKKNYKTFFKR